MGLLLHSIYGVKILKKRTLPIQWGLYRKQFLLLRPFFGPCSLHIETIASRITVTLQVLVKPVTTGEKKAQHNLNVKIC
jgi:hypothetical protein